jgi:hypothetical protein
MVLSIIVVLTNGDDKTGMLALCFVGWWGIEWSEFFTLNQSNREMPILIIELSFLVLCWIGWSIPLWIFANRRHRDPGILVRITGKLFAGTIVELLLAIPLTLIIKRRTDCYCATGSFGALIFSLMGCLWLFGPGIVIALFWKKRPWEKDHCFACGYPRKVAASTNCSECGTAFH